MRITLKGVPPSLNRFAGRQNTWEYRAEKGRWTRAVYYAALASKERPREPLPFAAVEIVYFFPDRRRHDADNYCGKFVLDGLTKAKIITDDDFAHIRLMVVGRYDKANPRTEIRVTEEETE